MPGPGSGLGTCCAWCPRPAGPSSRPRLPCRFLAEASPAPAAPQSSPPAPKAPQLPPMQLPICPPCSSPPAPKAPRGPHSDNSPTTPCSGLLPAVSSAVTQATPCSRGAAGSAGAPTVSADRVTAPKLRGTGSHGVAGKDLPLSPGPSQFRPAPCVGGATGSGEHWASTGCDTWACVLQVPVGHGACGAVAGRSQPVLWGGDIRWSQC